MQLFKRVNTVVVLFYFILFYFILFYFILFYFILFLRLNVFIFTEGKGGRKRKRNINVWLPLKCHLLGTWLTIQGCALTGNTTSDPFIQSGAQSTEPH